MNTRIALFALIAVAAAGPVFAADLDTVDNKIVVAYADLDLSKPAGRQVLEQRLSTAVAQVCPMPDLREITQRKAAEACRAKAEAAVRPQLAAVYDGKVTPPAIEVANRR